jgi:hypothetical protein
MPTCRRVRSLRQPRPVNALRIPLRHRQLKVTNSLPRQKNPSSSSQPDGTHELEEGLPTIRELRGDLNVGNTLPQNSPACICCPL